MQYKDAINEYFNYLDLTLKPTTTLNLARIFNKHITPYFENLDVSKIDNMTYLGWTNQIKKKNYSNRYNENIYFALKKFFDYLEKMYDIKNVPKKYGKFINTKVEIKKNKLLEFIRI